MYINYRIILSILLGCMIGNSFYAQCVAPKHFDLEMLNFNDDSQSVDEQKHMNKWLQNKWFHEHGFSVGVGVLIGVSTAAGSYCTDGCVSAPIHWLLWMAIFSKGVDIVSEDLARKNIYHDRKVMSVVAGIANGMSYFALRGYFGRLIDN